MKWHFLCVILALRAEHGGIMISIGDDEKKNDPNQLLYDDYGEYEEDEKLDKTMMDIDLSKVKLEPKKDQVGVDKSKSTQEKQGVVSKIKGLFGK